MSPLFYPGGSLVAPKRQLVTQGQPRSRRPMVHHLELQKTLNTVLISQSNVGTAEFVSSNNDLD